MSLLIPCVYFFSVISLIIYNAFLFSHMACQEERAEIAVILVENGANLHIQNKVGIKQMFISISLPYFRSLQ